MELFIAGLDAYYELEVNSLGTIYEVFFVWEDAYEKSGYARIPEFNRAGEGVRPFGGVGFKNHPRGRRIGFWRWDLPGLRIAVNVDGTVNDNSDRDRGWPVEIAIPWAGLAHLARADDRSLPPKDGDVWRMDFSRFNQYKEAPPAQDPGAGRGALTGCGTRTSPRSSRTSASPRSPSARQARPAASSSPATLNASRAGRLRGAICRRRGNPAVCVAG